MSDRDDRGGGGRPLAPEQAALLLSPEVRRLLALHGLSARIELHATSEDELDEPVTRLVEALREHTLREGDRRGLEAIGRLGAGVVHEVRNVMTGVLGLAQVAVRFAESPERVAQVVPMIEDESRRCVEILGHYLALARAPEQQAAPSREPIDCAELLRGTAVVLRHQMTLGKVRLVVAADDALPRPNGSVAELRQVLVNLALNAMQAMAPDGGELRIEARGERAGEATGGVCITLADTGPGIAPEVLPRLFDPFFTTRGANHGTGLGLFLSREIVEAHGGRIEVHSVRGHGATFAIHLPAGARP